jgi:hypothetical protein
MYIATPDVVEVDMPEIASHSTNHDLPTQSKSC